MDNDMLLERFLTSSDYFLPVSFRVGSRSSSCSKHPTSSTSTAAHSTWTRHREHRQKLTHLQAASHLNQYHISSDQSSTSDSYPASPEDSDFSDTESLYDSDVSSNLAGDSNWSVLDDRSLYSEPTCISEQEDLSLSWQSTDTLNDDSDSDIEYEYDNKDLALVLRSAVKSAATLASNSPGPQDEVYTASTASTSPYAHTRSRPQPPSYARGGRYNRKGGNRQVEEDRVRAVQRDVSTLTDVCAQDNLAEVQLVSLIEERLPRYVLRADTLTDFAGYDHHDWIQTPCLHLDDNFDLSPELIEETLKYFTLCAERLTQMTKTYNDIEAVTRLLEEKERDLELAARIGQTLLERNKKLLAENEELEDQLLEASEKVKQLKHEISLKDAIIQVYVQDYDGNSLPGSPSEQFNLDKGILSVELLQKKVSSLENENASLRLETSNLAGETDDLEEREQSLVEDAVKQLAEVNKHITDLRLEVTEKNEQSTKQQEEISRLSDIGSKINQKNKKLTIENEELQSLLVSAQETQHQLSLELAEWNERHDEVLALFHESSAEARDLRDSKHTSMPSGMPHYYTPMAGDLHLPEGSLAHELSDSLRHEDGVDGYSSPRRGYNRRVMDTARCVRRASSRGSTTFSSRATSITGFTGRSVDDMSLGGDSMLDSDDMESCISERGYHGDCESVNSSWVNTHRTRAPRLGRPGIPGSNDLETALRRLAMRKSSTDNTTNLISNNEDQQNANVVVPSISLDPSSTPTASNSPSVAYSQDSDSMMSYDSASTGARSLSAFPGLNFRMPERLQIVKPMEGSMTLHHWQRLATPHMGGLLDARPGIKSKGSNRSDPQDTSSSSPGMLYSITDFEEDDEIYLSNIPTSGTDTFTTATVLHPGEMYMNEQQSLSRRSSTGSIPAHVITSLDTTPSSTTSSSSSRIGDMLRERGLLTRMMMPAKRPVKKPAPSASLPEDPDVVSPSSYSSPAPLVPLEGISDTAEPLVIGNSFRLLERVKQLGVKNMITTCAAELPTLATGLNSILSSKTIKPQTTPSAVLLRKTKNKNVSLAATAAIQSGIGSRYDLVPEGLPRIVDYGLSQQNQRVIEQQTHRRKSAPHESTLHARTTAAVHRVRSPVRHPSGASTSSGTASDSTTITAHSPDHVKLSTKCSAPPHTDSMISQSSVCESSTDSCDSPTNRRARRPTVLRLPLTVEAQLYSKPDCMAVFDNEKPSTSKTSSVTAMQKSKNSVQRSPAMLKNLSKLYTGSQPASAGIAALTSRSQVTQPSEGVIIAPGSNNNKKPTTSGSSLAKLL